jgi:hypothetical protein
MTSEKTCVVVPWVKEEQRDMFLEAWNIQLVPDWLVLQHDKDKEGCGKTKNRGVAEAIERGAEIVIVLDDDCFPASRDMSMTSFITAHRRALEPQSVTLYAAVTEPPSRGTPYEARHVVMPVAASMGFWKEVPDYCAVRQLAFRNDPMTYHSQIVFGKYFSLCGMNLAFRPMEWLPWCTFIDVPRFDDIWMGWLWQREAYRRMACFNLHGPFVTHARQSNVWQNLRDETQYLEASETLWRTIALCPSGRYEDLVKLLPG